MTSYRLIAAIAGGAVAAVIGIIVLLPLSTDGFAPLMIDIQLSKVELSADENAPNTLLVEFAVRNDDVRTIMVERLQYQLFANNQSLGDDIISFDETLGIGGRNVPTLQPNNSIKLTGTIEPNIDLTKALSPEPVEWTTKGRITLFTKDVFSEKNFTSSVSK